jgi:hypothetical protein
MTIFNEFFSQLREDEEPKTCPTCKGDGFTDTVDVIKGGLSVSKVCDTCNGSGKVDSSGKPYSAWAASRKKKESITEEVQFKVGDVIERPDKPHLGKVVVVKVTEYGYVVKYRPNGVDPDPMMLHANSARNWKLAKP